MLFKVTVMYSDGVKEKYITFGDKGDSIKVDTQDHKIVAVGCRPFKYKVEKHPTLPISIVRYLSKTMIYPAQIECHPKTTLNDIKEISPKQKKTRVETTIAPVKEELKEWKFESSSGGGSYIVKQTKTGKLICNCPGVWRSHDRRCKHIKEVETY